MIVWNDSLRYYLQIILQTPLIIMLKLMILEAEPESAKAAQEAGIDRIFYDLEYIGKEARQ